MKKSLVVTLSLIGIFALLALFTINIYNRLVSEEENVLTQWSQVETQYQRRANLIPNLVNTVKGYASHEKETLNAVVVARSRATQVTLSIDDMDSKSIQKYQEAQGEVSAALGKLLMLQENYPDLKANSNFLKLQDQLEGTENRITVAILNFNLSAKAYNTYLRKFPTVLFAPLFGFKNKMYFEAEEGSNKAPEVQF